MSLRLSGIVAMPLRLTAGELVLVNFVAFGAAGFPVRADRAGKGGGRRITAPGKRAQQLGDSIGIDTEVLHNRASRDEVNPVRNPNLARGRDGNEDWIHRH